MAHQTNQTSVWLMPVEAVLMSLGISKPTLYREIKKGRLPAPVKISARRVGWRSSDIDRVVAGGYSSEAQS